MERPDDSSASRSQLEAQLYDLQHSMRNKLGILDGTFELMHPWNQRQTIRKKRISPGLNEILSRYTNSSKKYQA